MRSSITRIKLKNDTFMNIQNIGYICSNRFSNNFRMQQYLKFSCSSRSLWCMLLHILSSFRNMYKMCSVGKVAIVSNPMKITNIYIPLGKALPTHTQGTAGLLPRSSDSCAYQQGKNHVAPGCESKTALCSSWNTYFLNWLVLSIL